MTEIPPPSQTRSTETGSQGAAWVGWIQIAVILAVIVLAAMITIWLGSGADTDLGAPPEQPPAPVRVVQPEIRDHAVEIRATGSVDVTALVPLAPEVAGRIVEVSPSVRAGAWFEANELLFRIDPRDYQVAVSRARAALADARAAAQQEEAQAEIARNEWNSLYPNREITPLAAREPQLAAARARLMAAQSDLAQAELNLERTEVRLPFAGRITESRVEAGLLALAGQSLGSAFDVASVEIVAPVAPEDLRRLGNPQGRQVSVSIEGHGDSLTGTVTRVGSRVDGRTRFINLFIRLDEGAETLQPGLFADLVIAGPVLGDVMILPAAAVPGLDTVRVVDNGVVAERDVQVLDRTRTSAILARFDAGDGVIISALPENAVGSQAQIVDSTQ